MLHNNRSCDYNCDDSCYCNAGYAGSGKSCDACNYPYYQSSSGQSSCSSCSCGTNKYVTGCGGSSRGTCHDCANCGAGSERIGCGGNSAGSCRNCASG